MSIEFIERLDSDERAFAYVLGCYDLGQKAGYFPLERDAPTGHEHCFLAREVVGGLPVGFATCFDMGPARGFWLDLLWVELAHRRLGLGSKLVSAVQRHALIDGRKRIELGTSVNNKPMIALAGRLGLVLSECRIFVSGDGQ